MLDLITNKQATFLTNRSFYKLAILLRQLDCQVDYLFKEDFLKFYYKYLRVKPQVLISVSEEGPLPTLFKKCGLIRSPHIHCWTDDYTDIDANEYGISFTAFCEYYTVANADFIITPSIYRKERCELWGIPVFYIPHGVDANFDNQPAADLPGNIKVVYIGEQSARKRVDKLIAAAANLDCDVYLIGETNNTYKNVATPNVHFMGYIDYEKTPCYLKAADILALTPDDDCTLKMFEYIKAGKAILATRGKASYFLTHMENAYLTEDFSKGLRELINGSELRYKLAEGVKKIKVYTWEEVAQMWRDAIQTALEKFRDKNWRSRRRKVGHKSLASYIRSAL